jgi:hypothetical protein
MLCFAASVAVALGMSASSAKAQATFTSSTDFAAALAGQTVVTEGFEGPALDTVIPNGSVLDGITFDAFPAGTSGRIDDLFNHFDNQSLALERDNLPSFFFPGDTVTLTLPTPVTAVGIFFNTDPTNDAPYFLSTTSGSAFTGGGAYDTSTFYFAGLISSTPFQQVTIGSLPTSNSFNLDNLSFAPVSAVPEFGSLLSLGGLLAAGGTGLWIKRRRRR